MITPLEIQNHKFRGKIRGYNRDEVDHFLYSLAEEFENLLELNHKQEKEMAVLRARLKDLEGREKILKETMVSAQQIKNEIHDNAVKEAELIVREGQLKGEAIYEDAKTRVHQVSRQLADLKRVRDDLLAEVELMVARFGNFVDAERQNTSDFDKLHNFVSHRKRGDDREKAVKKQA